MHSWHYYQNSEEAAQAAADYLAETINQALLEKSQCHVVLPGGNSPKRCLSILSGMDLAWDKIHWYPGDERCCPEGHEDRNDVMMERHLWSQIGKTHIHRIPAELGPEEAAANFSKVIEPVDYFDIAFLGVGEDGHTASLFPGNPALSDTRSVVPVYNAPKPPPERVSLSMQTLKAAQTRIVLSGSASKSHVFEAIKQGETFPVNCIGDINWFIDTEQA